TIHTHPNMVITALLTMPGNLSNCFGEIFIVGKYGPAVTVASQRLARKKAGTPNSCKIARVIAFIGGTETLRGVLNHCDAMPVCNCVDFVVISTLAIQRYWNYGFRARSNRCL